VPTSGLIYNDKKSNILSPLAGKGGGKKYAKWFINIKTMQEIAWYACDCCFAAKIFRRRFAWIFMQRQGTYGGVSTSGSNIIRRKPVRAL
jgi:hypothetical protein